MSSIIRKKLFSQNAGTGGGGGSTPTTQIIRYNVLNYSALATLTPNTGEFAYVQNEQGTKWLPGTLGGTYYASGLYYYTGTTWINDLTSIAAQLAVNDTAILDLQTNKVPYSGATTNVNLGEYGITTGQLNLDLSPTGTAVVGTTRWNTSNGLNETTLLGGSVILKNGIDLVARVVNNTGIQLTKAAYQVVKVSGAQGQRLAVGLAQSNNDNNSADTLGVVIETINNNQEGFIMTVGQLEEVNTTGSLQGETWADGDVLYLSPTTPGAVTKVKPNGSTGHIVVIGYVIYAHANHGKIYIKIMNGWELEELHDVYISSYVNNGTLYRDTATNLWKTATIPTILGYTPVNGTGGTTNYISKFTGTNTIGNSLIQDNGTTLSIGVSPSIFYKLAVIDNTKNTGIFGSGSNTGIYGNGNLYGVYGLADNYLSTTGIGVKGEATYSGETVPPVVNIGGQFIANSGTNNYAVQLQDGTESVGKFLKCVGANGEANWDYFSSFIPELKAQETYRGILINNNSTTVVSEGGVTMSSSASTLAQSVASTNFSTKQVRLRYYATTVSAGRYTGTRGSALLWFIHGGFRYICDFNISDTAYSAGCQQFYGLAGQTTDLAYGGVSGTLVSTLTNIIGVGSENGDTNLQVFHNDATGTATKIDLGINFPANRTAGAISTTVYSITLYNAPASNDVLYRVVNNETGAIAEGTISTNLPLTSQGLNFFASRCMSTTSVTNTGQFDLSKLGCYSLL